MSKLSKYFTNTVAALGMLTSVAAAQTSENVPDLFRKSLACATEAYTLTSASTVERFTQKMNDCAKQAKIEKTQTYGKALEIGKETFKEIAPKGSDMNFLILFGKKSQEIGIYNPVTYNPVDNTKPNTGFTL